MEWYRPGAIVLQCGADSLAGDRLGCFNLSHRGHNACVQFVRKFNLPTLVLGGGGYTIRNVARCWVLETATVLNRSLPEELPFNDYFEYYAPDFSLSVPPNNMPDLNTPEYLHKCTSTILENLRHVQFAPSVQSHSVPMDMFANSEDDMDDANDDTNEFDSHDLWALSQKRRHLDEEELGASYHPSNPTSAMQDNNEENEMYED